MSLSQKQKKLLDCCPVLKEFKDFLENNVDDSHNDEDEGNDDNDEPVIGEDIIVYFTGKTIENTYNTPHLEGENVIVDWGDGTTLNYVISPYSHTYEEEGEHIIRISNVNILGDFLHSEGVTKVILSNTITKMDGASFTLSKITNIVVPPNVVEIIGNTFGNCPNLEEIILSEGIKKINSGFQKCPKLTKITFPKSIIEMKYPKFYNTPIEEITFLWDTLETIIPYDSDVYRLITSNYKFIIPQGTTSLYEQKGYPSDKLNEIE